MTNDWSLADAYSHPTRPVTCKRCGASAEQRVVPEGFDDIPDTYTLERTCSGECSKHYEGVLSASEAFAMTGHMWNGETGRWSRRG